ncbi:MAG: EAL domain-containing protein [Chroococcidiopsidaceae cyanobacterium CP_BM_ER_R8_30]|nr:EAL domain-containing protein [Chroococcidiopsidaceae cyanobacterium CP_BM_ER_R8_30]
MLLQVKIAENEIDEWLSNRLTEIKFMAGSSEVSSMNWSIIQPYLQSKLQHQPNFFSFQIDRRDGSYYTTWQGKLAEGKNVKDRIYFQEAMAGETIVADPVIGRITKIWSSFIVSPVWSNHSLSGRKSLTPQTLRHAQNLVFSHPPNITEQEERPMGVLAGTVAIQHVSEIVNKISGGKESYAFALDSTGHPIAYPNIRLVEKPSSFLMSTDPALAGIAQAMVNRQQGIQLVQIGGKQVYVAYSSLKQANWSLALVIPRANLERELGPLNLLASILGVLLVIFTLIAIRQIRLFQQIDDALHDTLTGLPSRALFMNRLKYAIEYSKRHENYLFAVLFLDLDRFKVVNDSLGHAIGDQLLRAVASRLATCLRSTDTLARLGGDEFTILLENLNDIRDVLRIVKRLQAELKLPFTLGKQEVFTTASIGIALNIAEYNQPEDLLRNADIAMYHAKQQGSARCEIFNTDMHSQVMARLQLETELRRAIEQQEFQVYYQAIVNLDTGLLAGFEALVRWWHPERGLVLPADFLPTAIEIGLNVPIDQWVLAQACRQTKQWQEQFSSHSPLTISVNLCSSHFAQPDLIKQLSQVLAKTNLEAHSLKLEITETVIMENSQLATQRILELRKLGVQLSIDDFGTGYSSLNRLYSLPINSLKIDRSFIKRIGDDARSLEIVETIMTLANNLSVDVTAEGLETKEQLAYLRELKCEYGQGYFFSHPLNSEAAEALIMTSPQW